MSMDDLILQQLGLIDPDTGEVYRGEGAEGGAPAGQPAGDRQPSAEDKWNTEENPHYRRVKELEQNQPSIGESLDQYKRTREAQAAEAIQWAISQGMSPQLARSFVEPQLAADLAQAELQANRQATLPMARRQAAEDIAKKNSDKNIVINPDELLSESSLEAMQSRAKTLRDERRKFKYGSRMASGVDRAEGATPVGSNMAEAMSKLSPEGKIKYGLARGDVK